MRNYLTSINIVGAVLMSRGGNISRYTLDWFYDNVDRVCITLDNYDKETEDIVKEYQSKYPDRTYIKYSEYPLEEYQKEGAAIKQRFKKFQHLIREELVKKLKEMHEEKPIDLLIWLDHDEIPINCFPEYLDRFWNEQTAHNFMTIGFVEVYNYFNFIISQRMCAHGRVFKYTPEFSCIPRRSRTIQNPYYGQRPWKIRHMLVHLCNFQEEDRIKRQYVSGRDMMTEMNEDRMLWILPKDVREMTPDEIADYQPSPKGASAKYKPIKLQDYLDNKEKYDNKRTTSN